MGKGASVKSGVLSASGDYILFTDADLSTPIEELDKLMPFFKEGYDVIIGSRAKKESNILRHQPMLRQAMGKVFNMLVRLLVLRGIKDTQCGFKLFKLFQIGLWENYKNSACCISRTISSPKCFFAKVEHIAR